MKLYRAIYITLFVSATIIIISMFRAELKFAVAPMVFVLLLFSIIFMVIRLIIRGRQSFLSNVVCPSCQKENPPGSKFCNYCGDSLSTAVICQHCGHINDKDAVSCVSCNALLK